MSDPSPAQVFKFVQFLCQNHRNLRHLCYPYEEGNEEKSYEDEDDNEEVVDDEEFKENSLKKTIKKK